MNSLKEKLARGELAASMTVRLVSSVEIVRIAKTAGFDAIYIDLEHSAFSIETTCQLSVMALEAGVIAPGVRGKHVGVGGLGSRPDLVQQYVAMGARFVSGTDLAFLLEACAARAKQVRSLKT